MDIVTTIRPAPGTVSDNPKPNRGGAPSYLFPWFFFFERVPKLNVEQRVFVLLLFASCNTYTTVSRLPFSCFEDAAWLSFSYFIDFT